MSKRRIVFTFKVPKSAKKVYLAGEFTNWDANALVMKETDDNVWVTETFLEPGEYEYKIMVDGVWYNDPNADKQIPNEWGSENSVKIVQ